MPHLIRRGWAISLSISHPLSNSGVTLRHEPSRGHDREGEQCFKRLLLTFVLGHLIPLSRCGVQRWPF